MDGPRFDTLTRRLGLVRSRRQTLGGVLFGALGLIGLDADLPAAKKKPCPPCKKRKKGKCKGLLPDGAACDGGACQGGTCVPTVTPPPPPTPSCPQGQRLCRGACQSILICCDDADCAAGRTCQQGVCACPPTKPLLCPGSQVCAACCTVTDCRAAGLDDGQVCQDGQCVCTIAGTRRCPAGTARPRECGHCCSSAECPGDADCLTNGSFPAQCLCIFGDICVGVCIPNECETQCTSSCPGGVPLGGWCCGDGALTCQEEGGPGGPRRCLPPF